ncbi:hypothetical protein C8R45DRAFT_1081851 [Mycena sanguinolenta]|nr:hypothetical protein C8R45DRAFT_1081851 [Mycena sanguinolenta]
MPGESGKPCPLVPANEAEFSMCCKTRTLLLRGWWRLSDWCCGSVEVEVEVELANLDDGHTESNIGAVIRTLNMTPPRPPFMHTPCQTATEYRRRSQQTISTSLLQIQDTSKSKFQQIRDVPCPIIFEVDSVIRFSITSSLRDILPLQSQEVAFDPVQRDEKRPVAEEHARSTRAQVMATKQPIFVLFPRVPVIASDKDARFHVESLDLQFRHVLERYRGYLVQLEFRQLKQDKERKKDDKDETCCGRSASANHVRLNMVLHLSRVRPFDSGTERDGSNSTSPTSTREEAPWGFGEMEQKGKEREGHSRGYSYGRVERDRSANRRIRMAHYAARKGGEDTTATRPRARIAVQAAVPAPNKAGTALARAARRGIGAGGLRRRGAVRRWRWRRRMRKDKRRLALASSGNESNARRLPFAPAPLRETGGGAGAESKSVAGGSGSGRGKGGEPARGVAVLKEQSAVKALVERDEAVYAYIEDALTSHDIRPRAAEASRTLLRWRWRGEISAWTIVCSVDARVAMRAASSRRGRMVVASGKCDVLNHEIGSASTFIPPEFEPAREQKAKEHKRMTQSTMQRHSVVRRATAARGARCVRRPATGRRVQRDRGLVRDGDADGGVAIVEGS